MDTIPAEINLPKHFGRFNDTSGIPVHVLRYGTKVSTHPYLRKSLFSLEDMILIYDICRYQKTWYLEHIFTIQKISDRSPMNAENVQYKFITLSKRTFV